MKETNIHTGHRQRMRDKIKAGGFDSLPAHEQIEYFLFTVIPRANTNHIAHALIKECGSVQEVFTAPIEKLTKVKGVGTATARFLKEIPMISGAYYNLKAKGVKVIKSPADIISTYLPIMRIKDKEEMFIVCLDSLGRVLMASVVNKGNTDEVNYSPTALLNLVSSCGASNVIIMHNHPNGGAKPSVADIDNTKRIYFALSAIDVCLLDHYIFNTAGEIYSFLDAKWFECFDAKFNETAPFFPTQTKMSAFRRMDKIKLASSES